MHITIYSEQPPLTNVIFLKELSFNFCKQNKNYHQNYSATESEFLIGYQQARLSAKIKESNFSFKLLIDQLSMCVCVRTLLVIAILSPKKKIIIDMTGL